MRIKLLSILFLVFGFNQLSFADNSSHSLPPFRIAGNLYYVGADDLASYLIVTPKGNILINSDLTTSVPLIKANIEKLGLKFEDIKILLINHAHYDHAGGSALIKKLTKAQYMVMAQDVPVVESGGQLDFCYGSDIKRHFPKTKVDRILHDGEQVALGDTVLTAHLTPGHTKGCTTWTLQVHDEEKSFQVVIAGSLTVNHKYQLFDSQSYPNIIKDYEHAFLTLKSVPCDIFLADHGRFFHLNEKYRLIKNNRISNSFIDTQGFKKYIELKERAFYRKCLSH